MRFVLHVALLYPIIQGLPSSRWKREPEIDSPEFWRNVGQEDLKRTLERRWNENGAKNVVLFIGDGMGVNTVTAARVYQGQQNGQSGEEGFLSWDRFPSTGLSKTFNTDYQVPDSAGTATAILTGVKTRLSLIGLDSSVTRAECDVEKISKASLPTLMDYAMELGRETGIVTTTRLTHATPASAYAKCPDRNWESDQDVPIEYRGICHDIAYQMVNGETASKIKVLMGGGRSKFRSRTNGGDRQDTDLIDQWTKSKDSYTILMNKRDLDNYDGQTDYVLGLFDDSHIPYAKKRNVETDPTLEDMVLGALRRLDRNDTNGFFLLVEGGRIDHAHHDNLAKLAFDETSELDRAVKSLLEMVNLDETLVIVTADHSHSMTMNGYPKRGNDIMGYVFEGGYYMNYIQLPDGNRLPYSTISYANGPGYYDHFVNQTYVDIRELNYTSYDYRAPAMWHGPEDYETHGGEDVPIYAIGPYSHLFIGVHEQNYITHAIVYAMERN